MYGISQNQNTNDYIIVLQDDYCENCGNQYTDMRNKWCKPCQINNIKGNFVNWTSGNKEIDNFIQEMQLKINSRYDVIFEWIPYNQFYNIKEIEKSDSVVVYSAIWMNGPLDYNFSKSKQERIPNNKVTLKYFYNSQNFISEFLNMV